MTNLTIVLVCLVVMVGFSLKGSNATIWADKPEAKPETFSDEANPETERNEAMQTLVASLTENLVNLASYVSHSDNCQQGKHIFEGRCGYLRSCFAYHPDRNGCHEEYQRLSPDCKRDYAHLLKYYCPNLPRHY
eukprot:scpid100908/ scgid30970/ 